MEKDEGSDATSESRIWVKDGIFILFLFLFHMCVCNTKQRARLPNSDGNGSRVLLRKFGRFSRFKNWLLIERGCVCVCVGIFLLALLENPTACSAAYVVADARRSFETRFFFVVIVVDGRRLSEEWCRCKCSEKSQRMRKTKWEKNQRLKGPIHNFNSRWKPKWSIPMRVFYGLIRLFSCACSSLICYISILYLVPRLFNQWLVLFFIIIVFFFSSSFYFLISIRFLFDFMYSVFFVCEWKSYFLSFAFILENLSHFDWPRWMSTMAYLNSSRYIFFYAKAFIVQGNAGRSKSEDEINVEREKIVDEKMTPVA